MPQGAEGCQVCPRHMGHRTGPEFARSPPALLRTTQRLGQGDMWGSSWRLNKQSLTTGFGPGVNENTRDVRLWWEEVGVRRQVAEP